MKTIPFLFIIIMYCNITLSRAQTTSNSGGDTLTSSNEKEIFKEYTKRQQDRALPISHMETDDTTATDLNQKLKFIILCFNLTKSYENEIVSLNKIAKEYEAFLSSFVIKAEDLIKYKEVFSKKEFKSLQDFILNKNESQRRSTSFPVILILDKNGKVLNAWSGDKTEDGLKSNDYYIKIKAGLENISIRKP
jgi:hypothetical protein